MASDSVIKKVVRDVVKEELKTSFDSFKSDILEAIDQKNDNLSDSIDKKNYNLRSDIAKMKDEIVGELKTIREEQTILNGRTVKINEVEDRVDKLEDIHPHSQHASI